MGSEKGRKQCWHLLILQAGDGWTQAGLEGGSVLHKLRALLYPLPVPNVFGRLPLKKLAHALPAGSSMPLLFGREGPVGCMLLYVEKKFFRGRLEALNSPLLSGMPRHLRGRGCKHMEAQTKSTQAASGIFLLTFCTFSLSSTLELLR